MSKKDNEAMCPVCSHKTIELIHEYENFVRVTSDCQPWKRGGKIGVCRFCSFAVKPYTDDFKEECGAIYNDYKVYFQAKGSEQLVCEGQSGLGRKRSELLISTVIDELCLPESGHLLDVGCGNGNLLLSASQLLPHWRLAGQDIGEKYKSVIENIPGVVSYQSSLINSVKGQYDLITMLHVLEHLTDPVRILKILRLNLTKDGIIVIQVPDYTENPFDLLIADHSIHFDVSRLSRLLEIAGFDILCAASNKVIPKEITLFAKRGDDEEKGSLSQSLDLNTPSIKSGLKWLNDVKSMALQMFDSNSGKTGIFGTSIAGTWMGAELEDKFEFFVDEDTSRIGQTFMGKPILAPSELSENAVVFVPLAPVLALNIQERLAHLPAKFIIPDKTIA